MLAIAKQVGFSETAFVLPPHKKNEGGTFCVRFFAVSSEVDMCGHATIAAWSYLLQKNIIQPGEYT